MERVIDIYTMYNRRLSSRWSCLVKYQRNLPSSMSHMIAIVGDALNPTANGDTLGHKREEEGAIQRSKWKDASDVWKVVENR
jgi:hypothetical protein